MTKDEIAALVEKGEGRLTTDEKKMLRKVADEMGIEYVIKGARCKGCYERLMLKIYEAIPVDAIESVDGFAMRDPRHSFMCLGRLWTNELMKDAEVGKLHPHVIETYFKKKDE